MSPANHLNHQDKFSSSLQDLNEDIDLIYQNYMNGHDSNDTLDSQTHQVSGHRRLIPEEVMERFKQSNDGNDHISHSHDSNLPIHISSRLSSIRNDHDITQSAPQTPNSNGSFDFNPRKTYAMSNASLNILDTPSIEHDFKDMKITDNVVGSTDALKSVLINDSSNNEFEPIESEDYEYEQEEIEEESEKDYIDPNSKQDDWQQKGGASRTISGESGYKVIRRNVTDFEFGKQLGEGSYSTVVLATDKITSKKYAVKILDKRHIIKEKKVKYVNIEKHALNRLSNRMGIISLYFTFQDKDSLYFVLDYASNGELLSLIKKYNTLSEDCTRYFGAQILDAIKFMHDNGIIHRDIKPENILLDDNLRIQITDFGTARLLEKKNDESEEYPVDIRAKSFVGTAEYVSPELLDNKYCGKPGDIWAFGCIIYQMIAGKPPFKAANEYLTFQKITKLQYAFSAGFPIVIRDLIKQILVLQPSKRANIPTIQNHYFFSSIDFNDFDSIWLTSPPELGPYKMSAKSMMKVPELTKSPSTQSVNVRKTVATPRQKRVASEPSSASSNGNQVSTTNSNSAGHNGKFVNPASAAAFVLNKKDSSSDIEESEESITPKEDVSKSSSRTSAHNHTPRSAPQPEYIPGTNILRPTIHTLQSYSRSSSNTKKKSIRTKPKPKTLEVTPITALEVAWKQYLNHSDERILKIGPVIASKSDTESFERKYKGLIHDSPLGFQTKRNNTSFLSQVVNGNSGLRGSSMNSSTPSDSVTHDDVTYEGEETDAIIDYFLIEETSAGTLTRSETNNSSNNNSSRGSKFLKKLGISNALSTKEKEQELITQHPLEKPRTCTMVITSHGRVLIFFRNDPEANYRLISEILLSFEFISFKEVITSSNSKLSRLLPSTGLFAIVSKESTFTFEVEKYEINGWTESLAKAQTNQFERIKLDKSGKFEKLKSPKLMESPAFPDRNVEKELKREERHSYERAERAKSPKPESNHLDHKESLLTNKIKSRSSVKRKPPPPISNGLDMSTGLSQENGMLTAAQLAVSHSTATPTFNRRSSFSKEDKPSTYKVVKQNASGGITQMNSKFLARSHRKK